MPLARVRVSRTGKSRGFTNQISWAVVAVQSALGVSGRGREISSYGHVPIAVCQSQQSRDTVAAGEEQLGRFTAGREHTTNFICTVAS
jgi:hypothetical protein